jgi:hypothetical protein
VPFSWLKQDYLQIVGAIRGGEQPKMPKEVSLQLRLLIKDCWAQAPGDWPTFPEIMQQMTSEKICFPGTHQALTEQFYAKKNPARPVTDDTEQVITLTREPRGELLDCLQ